MSDIAAELQPKLKHLNDVLDKIGKGEPVPENDEILDEWRSFGWQNDSVKIPSVVWGVMLDLIYSGRVNESLKFVDDVWPDNRVGKNDFKKDILLLVKSSWFGRHLPWYPDIDKAIKTLN